MIVWVGKNYLFDLLIVAILCINFYFAGIRKSVQTFREATGLFYMDRWKSVIEALVNIGCSVALGMKYGVMGIFLGTTITYLFTCNFIEPFILYKYCFKKKFRTYCIDFFKRIIILILACYLSN